MSRRVTLLAAAAVVGSGMFWAPLAAQDLEHLERLVERRAEMWRDARARADSLAQLQPWDTVTSGPLTALTPRDSRVVVQEAVRLLRQCLDSAMGSDAELMEAITLVGRDDPSAVMPPSVGSGPAIALFQLQDQARVSQTADRMTSALAASFLLQVPQPTRAWAASAAFFPGVQASRLDRVYQRLATQPSRVARDCFAGDVGQCAAALALAEVEDPIMVWYDASDRRHLVENCWACNRRPGYGDCLAGSDEACAAVMRAAFIPQPLDHSARISVLRVALREGGDGAFGRLVNEGGTDVAQHLAAVAGMPLDSLLETWHREIMGGKPRPPAMRRGEAWAALFWVLVFAALGFRSTRWR